MVDCTCSDTNKAIKIQVMAGVLTLVGGTCISAYAAGGTYAIEATGGTVFIGGGAYIGIGQNSYAVFLDGPSFVTVHDCQIVPTAASGGEYGLLTAGAVGAILRQGEGVDLSQLANPVLVQAGDHWNRGTVQLNGTAAQPVSWTKAAATDTIVLQLVTLGGAGTGLAPSWAANPGVGFNVTGSVGGDTSTWSYFIP